MTKERRIELLEKLKKDIRKMPKGTVFQLEGKLCVITSNLRTNGCGDCPILRIKAANTRDDGIFNVLIGLCCAAGCSVYYAKSF